MHKSRISFTLAEMLITLTVIGVIASITIPALMKSYQYQVYTASFKRDYSILNQAFMNIKQDECGGTFVGCFTSPDDIVNKLGNHLKHNQICPLADNCFTSSKCSKLSLSRCSKSKGAFSIIF